MSEEIAIKVENLTKAYKLYDSPKDRLKESINPFGKVYHHEFHALHEVSFEVRKGQTVGIIGCNGSGKSTLLKIITGVLTPSSGSVSVNGKISALLELGAGFNPELTGIENIYFNGTLMGYTRDEMDAKLESILAFADIGEFISQPVKLYSSGMFVRLAFAVSVCVEPEIMIVDEALSVGDMAFQQKCLDRLEQLRELGTTILLVTHDIMVTRNYCSSVVYLNGGKVRLVADPETAGEMYIRDMHEVSRKDIAARIATAPKIAAGDKIRFGGGGGEITGVCVMVNGENLPYVDEGKDIDVTVYARIDTRIRFPALFIQIRDFRGYIIYGRHTHVQDLNYLSTRDDHTEISASARFTVILAPGEYGITVSLNDKPSDTISIVLDKQVAMATFTVLAPAVKPNYHGIVNLNATWAKGSGNRD